MRAEAEPLLLSAERQLHALPGMPARYRRNVTEHLVQLYEAWGKAEQAEKGRKKLQ